MLRTAWLASLVALLAAAGCIQVGSPEPDAPPADDGRTTLQLQVVDAADARPVADARATLLIVGSGSVRKATDGEGRATFTVAPTAACSVTVEKDGYQTAAAALDCSQDKAVRVPLRAAGAEPRPTGVPTAAPLPTAAPPGSVLLQGTVVDADSGSPLRGVLVRLDAPLGPSHRTADDGLFAFAVTPGPHLLETQAPCRVPAALPLDLAEDTVLDVRLAVDATLPAPPGGVRATAGPGPGMVTVSWQDAPGAAGYVLLRGGQPFHELGDSRAYGVPGATASDRFSVASANSCGLAGAPSGEVSASPLPGPSPLVAPAVNVEADVGLETYPAFAGDGTPLPPRAWRTVEGTGNCCENYLATTRDGLLLDQGGSTLMVSRDEGRSWTGVKAPVVLVEGEGSVAAAPDGDIVAFDWATYNADTAFAYRYSAATGEWHWQFVPMRTPVYDRTWIATIKGPFEVGGVVVPYVTVVEGGTVLKTILVSLDGLTYQPSDQLLGALGTDVDLRSILAAPDENRDWIHGLAEFPILPAGNGVGALLDRGLGMQGTPVWGQAALPTHPGDLLRIDSAGTLHSVAVDSSSILYARSHDGGTTWSRLTVPIAGGDVYGTTWDFQAHAGLDQAILGVHVAKLDGDDQFRLYRFRGLAGPPVLTEALDLGAGDHPFRGDVTGGGDRFDFMTVRLLPSGKAVLSFGDAAHAPPAIAIEA